MDPAGTGMGWGAAAAVGGFVFTTQLSGLGVAWQPCLGTSSGVGLLTNQAVCLYERLEAVCHESVANRANRESWLVGRRHSPCESDLGQLTSPGSATSHASVPSSSPHPGCRPHAISSAPGSSPLGPLHLPGLLAVGGDVPLSRPGEEAFLDTATCPAASLPLGSASRISVLPPRLS